MKLAITTRADNNIKNMTDLTHPIIRDYAKKWGCDFIILNKESKCKEGHRKNHYRIMDVEDLLNEYDRILNLDSDIIINKYCPNLFDIVPEKCIGTIYEDKGSRRPQRLHRINEIQMKYRFVGWGEGYINTGVFLVSKIHRNIFSSINGEYWLGEGEDDVHIGYNIHRLNFEVFELNYKWNHMTMFSESWNNNANRFDSYIIHYAGNGTFDQPTRMEQIIKDKEHIYGK